MKIAMKERGLCDDSREVGASIAKDHDDRGSEKDLDRSVAQQYRGGVASINYLGQDRGQRQPAVKEMSRGVAKPTEKGSRKTEEPAQGS